MRKGVIQANRHERHRQARQDMPRNVKLGILAVVVVLVLFVMIAAAVQKDPAPTNTTPSLVESENVGPPTEAECVSLRRQWNGLVDLDFKKGQAIQADYRSRGCYDLCGDLVEDTDTSARRRAANTPSARGREGNRSRTRSDGSK